MPPRPPALLSPATPRAFRAAHLLPATPCRFGAPTFAALPALQTWFTASGQFALPYFGALVPAATRVEAEASTAARFERVELPLLALLAHLNAAPAAGQPALYLAQAPLLDQVPALRAALPTPALVAAAGRGDVYAANVWLGRCEHIDTPLHRDPNPNIFVQLRGRKVLRLFSPALGRTLVEAAGQGRFRSAEEMMMGEGRKRVAERVWGADEQEGAFEVEVGEGEGVFIPKGWWHAVKGVGEGVGASVNWWFR